MSLANAATRADDRLITLALANRLDEIGALFTEDTRLDDRRQGFRCEINGRATAVDNICSIAALEVAVTKSTIAVRGDRLCLSRERFEEPAAFCVETLEITEVDSQGVMTEKVVFDLDDFDAALAELDVRYFAGEAAPYAQTWSVVLKNYAAANRQELNLTSDCMTIDHRRGRAFSPGEAPEYMRATWDLAPDVNGYIETVHRLNNVGALITHVVHGTSQAGFTAEWREVILLTFEGELVNRGELFDEEDLDVALAKLDELSRPVRRLENTASRATDRFLELFAARDWEAMARMVIDDISFDDRRRVINADLQTGRNAFIEGFRIAADLGATQFPHAIATRGERVVLVRARFSLGGGAPEEFGLDLLHVIEVDADNRIAATVTFDPDDVDAAVAELDTRYLAGESVGHAQTWMAIARNVAAFNRREPLMTTSDWVTIDHRRATAFEPGDITPYIHATWDVAPDINLRIEAVHRLNNSGALFTQVLKGTSKEGFDAEWRDVIILTADGAQLSSLEVFDETDLAAALTRFDELSRPAQRLENAASRVYERIFAYFASRDWTAMKAVIGEDILDDDRRRVANAGIRRGRTAMIANIQAGANLGARSITSTVIATRGNRLALRHLRFSGEGRDAFHNELLGIAEINDDQRVVVVINSTSMI